MTRELIDVVSSEALTEAGAFVACANSLFAGIAARDSEWTAPIARDEDEDEDFEIEDDGDDFGEEEEFGDEDAEEEKDKDEEEDEDEDEEEEEDEVEEEEEEEEEEDEDEGDEGDEDDGEKMGENGIMNKAHEMNKHAFHRMDESKKFKGRKAN